MLCSAAGAKTGNFTNIVVAALAPGLVASFHPTNGTLSFATAVVAPPTLNFAALGGGVWQFSWTGSFKLQSQTNAVAAGLGTNWFDYPGGGSSPVNVAVTPAAGSVFFRLRSP